MNDYEVSGLLETQPGSNEFVSCKVQYIQAETVGEAIAQAIAGWGFLQNVTVKEKEVNP